MRKLGQLILLLFSCCLFLGWNNVKAADFSIDSYHVNIDILADGSANVNRTLTYDFDGEAHGLLYQQAVRDQAQSLTDSKVFINNQPVILNASQANNTYTLTREGNLYKFKVYHPVDGDQLKITYKYHLNQVVKNYADTAELNWKIIGSNWDQDLANVKITINLPKRNVKSLQAWSHGDLSGYTKVDKQRGQVTLSLASNPANSFVEAHLLFDPKVTFANTYRSSERVKAKIQAQEAALAKKANAARKKQRLMHQIGALFLLIVGFGLNVFTVLRLSRRPKNTLFPASLKSAPHNFEIPDLPVATAQALCFFTQPNSYAFSAHLLELEAQGQIAIEPLDVKKGLLKDQPNYLITLVNARLMHAPEEKLLQYLFKLNSKPVFSLKDLQNLSSKKKKRLAKLFEAWSKQAFEQADIKKYQGFAHPAVSLSSAWVATNLCFFIAMMFANRWELLSLLGLVSLGLAGLDFYCYKNHSPYLKEDVAKINQVRGFYTMLDDIGRFDLRELGERILWSEIMPYAVAFKLAPKVAKALYANFSEAELATVLGSYYPLFYHQSFAFATSFNNSFTAAIVTYSSSSTGSSGGFSGGSSGGFGGSSGGGAF